MCARQAKSNKRTEENATRMAERGRYSNNNNKKQSRLRRRKQRNVNEWITYRCALNVSWLEMFLGTANFSRELKETLVTNVLLEPKISASAANFSRASKRTKRKVTGVKFVATAKAFVLYHSMINAYIYIFLEYLICYRQILAGCFSTF